jgi:hypothetical protein
LPARLLTDAANQIRLGASAETLATPRPTLDTATTPEVAVPIIPVSHFWSIGRAPSATRWRE